MTRPSCVCGTLVLVVAALGCGGLTGINSFTFAPDGGSTGGIGGSIAAGTGGIGGSITAGSGGVGGSITAGSGGVGGSITAGSGGIGGTVPAGSGGVGGTVPSGSGGATVVGSGGVGPPVTPGAREFTFTSETDLAPWTVFRSDHLAAAPTTSNGNLVLIINRTPPSLPAFWDANLGPALWLPWSGDFVVDARARARDQSNPASAPPANDYSGVGLALFDAAEHPVYQRYYLVEIGRAGGALGVMAEIFAPVAGATRSSRADPPGSVGLSEATLRLCRKGMNVSAYYRANDTQSFSAATFAGGVAPPVLSAAVHVAIVASDWANGGGVLPSLYAEVDLVRITPLGTADTCTSVP